MTDFHALLPAFPHPDRYAALLAGLETHRVGLSELLTLDAAELGRRTRLPLLDLQRFSSEVRGHLAGEMQRQVGGEGGAEDREAEGTETEETKPSERRQRPLPGSPDRISTLDARLDAALGGGFPTGALAEVVGESGAGKTQLLLRLLLAVQLPPPRGLGRKAVYIATEAPLATGRLAQMVRAGLSSDSDSVQNFLAGIVTINTPDLEAQEHILTHQLPVHLAQTPPGTFGLVVVDSVAANFRPFFGGGGGGGNLAARGLELARLGMLLRTLAQQHGLAVVVANQVADRFEGEAQLLPLPSSQHLSAKRPRAAAASRSLTQESPLAARSTRHGRPLAALASSQTDRLSSQELFAPPSYASQPPLSGSTQDALVPPPPPPVLQLDHQQRWFTGWGDDLRGIAGAGTGRNKTPALGLVWATQLAMRVALLKTPRRDGSAYYDEHDPRLRGRDGRVGAPRLQRSWRRWLKVVFAAQAAPSGGSGPVEFEITAGGLAAV